MGIANMLLFRAFRRIIRAFVAAFFSLLPVDKNKIVVSCFVGKGYCDNPKYIIDALLLMCNTYHIFWLVNGDGEAKTLPPQVEPRSLNSIKAIYHTCTAAVWIDNTRKVPFYYIKRRKQLYMQTWHGGGYFKKIEHEIVEYLKPSYVTAAIKDAKATDIMISDGRLQSQYYQKHFWYNGYIAEVGAPRNDILNRPDESVYRKVRAYYGVRSDTKIILYAPTFRKDRSITPYNINYDQLIRACEARFGGKFVAFVHLHPNVSNKYEQIQYDNEMIFNTTHYPDLQELLIAADVMISDYSSVEFDFALTKKPAFRYAVDIEKYAHERGGFIFDIDEYPFPLARSKKELIEVVLNFNSEKYEKALSTYLFRLGEVISDHAARDCATIVHEFLMNGLDKDKCFRKFRAMLIPPLNQI